jgi:phosphoribosylamine--glycine ligase
MASADYPITSSKGKPIFVLEEVAHCPNVKVFQAGTAFSGDQIVTNGGRILGVTAWAKDLRGARDAAYAAVERIHFDGARFRRDIAAKALGAR